jgi:hypothetical protein
MRSRRRRFVPQVDILSLRLAPSGMGGDAGDDRDGAPGFTDGGTADPGAGGTDTGGSSGDGSITDGALNQLYGGPDGDGEDGDGSGDPDPCLFTSEEITYVEPVYAIDPYQ